VGGLKAAKRDPLQTAILTERVRGVFDDLLGKDAWSPPRNWGRTLVTFPEPGACEVPASSGNWDNPAEPHLDHPTALFVVSFIGPVAPCGGTLILPARPACSSSRNAGLPRASGATRPLPCPGTGSTELRSTLRRPHP